MRDRESRIRNWVSRELLVPCNWSADSEPFVSHLIGTDRAFGIFFPEFFLPRELYSRPFAEQIARMHVAARIVLIADDALRDGDYSRFPRPEVQELHSGAVSLFTECLRKTGIDANRCDKTIHHHRTKTDRAYAMSAPTPPELAHTRNRCSWFYAAFDALAQTARPTSLAATKRCFTLALYVLQLADDYADYDQDTACGSPYNVMTLGGSIGQINSKDRQWLQGYAAYAISRLCRRIMAVTPIETPIHNWARAIQGLIAIPDETAAILSKCPLAGLGHRTNFVSPVACGPLRALPFADVMFCTMNGVVLNAESVNVYASLRALSSARSLGFSTVKDSYS
jgi:hypothetical protein